MRGSMPSLQGQTLVIGVDLSLNHRNDAVAFGVWNRRELAMVRHRESRRDALLHMPAMMLADKPRRILLVLNAPLGWPEDGDQAFRQTDAFIRRVTGVRLPSFRTQRVPRLARTAEMWLGDLRRMTGSDWPVLRSHASLPEEGAAVIEAYPEVAIARHGLDPRPFRARAAADWRARIVRRIQSAMHVPDALLDRLIESPKALGAAMGVLAGFDFLDGHCQPPLPEIPVPTLEGEGWIQATAKAMPDRPWVALAIETTGLSPETERIVALGMVRFDERGDAVREFSSQVHPGKAIPEEIARIHGLDAARLADAPEFAGILDAVLEMLRDAHVVVHQAEFTLGFLAAELRRCGVSSMPWLAAHDLHARAQACWPGQRNTLDALARRLGVEFGAGEGGDATLAEARAMARMWARPWKGGRETASS